MIKTTYVCMYFSGDREGGQECHSAHVVVRGQFMGVSSLLQSCDFSRLGSGHQACQQVPLSAKPSFQP